jgi:hypothetical protein
MQGLNGGSPHRVPRPLHAQTQRTQEEASPIPGQKAGVQQQTAAGEQLRNLGGRTAKPTYPAQQGVLKAAVGRSAPKSTGSTASTPETGPYVSSFPTDLPPLPALPPELTEHGQHTSSFPTDLPPLPPFPPQLTTTGPQNDPVHLTDLRITPVSVEPKSSADMPTVRGRSGHVEARPGKMAAAEAEFKKVNEPASQNSLDTDIVSLKSALQQYSQSGVIVKPDDFENKVLTEAGLYTKKFLPLYKNDNPSKITATKTLKIATSYIEWETGRGDIAPSDKPGKNKIGQAALKAAKTSVDSGKASVEDMLLLLSSLNELPQGTHLNPSHTETKFSESAKLVKELKTSLATQLSKQLTNPTLGKDIAEALAQTSEGKTALTETLKIPAKFQEAFLTNTALQTWLQAFCTKEFSTENTNFILETEQAIQTAKTPQDKSKAIDHLLTTYVNPGKATQEVNLPSLFVKNLNTALAENPLNLEAFRAPQGEIITMTHKDSVLRWLNSQNPFSAD